MTGPPAAGVLRYIRCLDHAEEGDGQLLQRFVGQQDETAFAALLRRHGPMVLGVCRQVLTDAQDAEDAFQAVFLVLARKAASIRERESLAAWLHQVAVNIARTARSSAARRRIHERQAAAMSGIRSVEAVPPGDWQPLLHEEVNRLPQKYRIPIVLCHLDGKTTEQAARQLGWPVGTVKSRLARARDMLRRRLTRRGLAVSTGGLALALAQGTASGGVPDVLLRATLRAVVPFAGARALPAGFSSQAVTLAKGALQATTAAKETFVTLLLLVLGGFGVGGAALSLVPGQASGPSGQPPEKSEFGPVTRRLEREVVFGVVAREKKKNGMADRPIEQLIADLDSEDGVVRVAATKELIKRGKDALPDLQRAGARQLGVANAAPRRLDMVYSLLEGLPDPAPRSGYRTDRLNIYVTKDCTKEEVAEWGMQFGFTPFDICYSSQPPHCGALLAEGKTLSDVLQALLMSEPKIVTVQLGYWE
jgi:RNA polymerase sigma factor (sigma-70 family)